MGSKYMDMTDTERDTEQRWSKNKRRTVAGREPIYDGDKAGDAASSEEHRTRLQEQLGKG